VTNTVIPFDTYVRPATVGFFLLKISSILQKKKLIDYRMVPTARHDYLILDSSSSKPRRKKERTRIKNKNCYINTDCILYKLKYRVLEKKLANKLKNL
jgi:hypothetical protein